MPEKDFAFKTQDPILEKEGKREHLNDFKTKAFTAKLNDYFETTVEVPRMKVGERQTIETLIIEEALLFAKFLKGANAKNGFPG